MSQTNVQFDVGQLLGEAWNLFKDNIGPFLGGVLVMLVLLSASSITYIGPIILSGPMMLGLYKMILSAIRRQPVEFGDLFSGFKQFLPGFLAYLVITIFTSVGMIFCIIPGILISILYAPTYLFILDDNLDFWNAMEASRKMVMNNFGQWLVLSLILFLINLAGTLACCVGILVSMPVSLLVIALAYDLQRRADVPPLPPTGASV